MEKCNCGGELVYKDTIYITKLGMIIDLVDLFKCKKCDKEVKLES